MKKEIKDFYKRGGIPEIALEVFVVLYILFIYYIYRVSH